MLPACVHVWSIYKFTMLHYLYALICTNILTHFSFLLVPSQPPHNILDSSQGTTWINLTWTIPLAGGRNGIIINYVIDLSSRDENITVDVQTPTFSTPENLYYNITGLSAGSEYTVRVAASTVNGTGPFTEEVRISTLDDGGCMCIMKQVQEI